MMLLSYQLKNCDIPLNNDLIASKNNQIANSSRKIKKQGKTQIRVIYHTEVDRIRLLLSSNDNRKDNIIKKAFVITYYKCLF